ncbi:MAG TPA: hypothetical protein VLD35_11235 [Caldimonas sp.]|nr:hypothetical protein [Caldimonas sp.]
MPPDDVSVRRIVLAGALIAGTVALVVGVIVLILAHWHLPLGGPSSADYAIREPEPALESAPQLDLQRYRQAKQALLTTSAWVDRSAGVDRVPIATAMTLLTDQGLRAASAASAASAAAAGAKAQR